MDWTGQTLVNGHVAGGLITPSGIAIPSIPPGGDTILSHDWMPPRPQDFDSISGKLGRIGVCGLARIQTTNVGADYGMTFVEQDTTKVNVLNNNNIVTRNFVLLNLSNTTTPNTKTIVVVGNTGTGNGSGTQGKFTIQLATENQIHPWSPW